MKRKYIFLSWVFVLGSSLNLLAQNVILAPDLACIKNDTIFWDAPVGNNCGPFQSYLLFGSINPDGPYNLIANITDPTQTSYYHDTPGNQVWYYYMQTAHNCPGFIRWSSDTLSTAPIPRVVLTQVSVLNGQAYLEWLASTAPQVDRYIIYRNTPNGTIPIDTVFNGTSYIDLQAQPNVRSEIYYVIAADRCGNTSLFDVLHQTILVTSSVVECDRRISLSWNPYVNWPGGLDSQEIWVSVNGANAQWLASVDASTSTYAIEDVDAQTNYCITIRAFEQGSSASSVSNEICLMPDIVQPPRQMQITYIHVNPAQEVELEWIWETYAELNLAGIERSNAGGPFQAIQPIVVTPPLLAQNMFVDNGSDARQERLTYRVFARDGCDEDWISADASAVWLNAYSRPNFSNELIWTPLQMANIVVESYDVYEIRGNLILPLGQTLDTSFVHILEPGRLPLEPVCYVIETTFTLTLPNGQIRRISRSNVACASQEVKVWMPNAFAPRGLNHLFRPLLVFAEEAEYELVVYNRWGGEVFRTTDPDTGWDGTFNGGDAAPGVYVWQMSIQTIDGQQVDEKGTVTLLR